MLTVTVPLLCDTRQSVWTPESALQIIGIQSSFRKGQFIRAKSWEFVMAILRKIDPQLVAVSGEPS